MRRIALLASLWLAACATPSTGPSNREATPAIAAATTVAPNPNLLAQGIPPVPVSLVEQVARYTDFRGHNLVEWHPQRRELLVSHRRAGGSTLQLFRVTAPMAEPEPLTDFSEPVRRATWEPRRGDYLVFARSNGGDEADQLYRLDLDSRHVTLLTDPTRRHDIEQWLNRSSQLLVSSVPLDRTAQGGTREEVSQTLTLIDPAQPTRQRRIAELPGTGWAVGGVSRDDRQVALTRYLSATESQVWLLDLASGRRAQLLPAPGSKEQGTFFAGPFQPDGQGLWVRSDRGGEFRQLWRYDLRQRTMRPVSGHIPWDVDGVEITLDGRLVVGQVNGDGRGELLFRRVHDTTQAFELYRVGRERVFKLFDGAESSL